MPKKRMLDSLLTKLENMEINDQIWTNKSNGYVADSIATIKKTFPTRVYKQNSVYTHFGSTFSKLSDFKKIIFITRIA